MLQQQLIRVAVTQSLVEVDGCIIAATGFVDDGGEVVGLAHNLFRQAQVAGNTQIPVGARIPGQQAGKLGGLDVGRRANKIVFHRGSRRQVFHGKIFLAVVGMVPGDGIAVGTFAREAVLDAIRLQVRAEAVAFDRAIARKQQPLAPDIGRVRVLARIVDVLTAQAMGIVLGSVVLLQVEFGGLDITLAQVLVDFVARLAVIGLRRKAAARKQIRSHVTGDVLALFRGLIAEIRFVQRESQTSPRGREPRPPDIAAGIYCQGVQPVIGLAA